MRPNRFHVLMMIGLCMMMVGLSACVTDSQGKTDVGATVTNAGGVVATVAPFLPGPVGGVVAGVGTALTLLGGLFAGRKKAEAIKQGPDAVASLNPLVKAMSERKWLFPIVGMVIAGGNMANLWHIDTEKLLTFLGALGVPAGLETWKDVTAVRAGEDHKTV